MNGLMALKIVGSSVESPIFVWVLGCLFCLHKGTHICACTAHGVGRHLIVLPFGQVRQLSSCCLFTTEMQVEPFISIGGRVGEAHWLMAIWVSFGFK